MLKIFVLLDIFVETFFQDFNIYMKILKKKIAFTVGSVYLIETWFVCFSPDEGWLHRAVKIRDRVHIIEELQLFEEKQPINNMVISQKQVARYTPNNC